MANRSNNSNAIDLVESVFYVHKKKISVFRGEIRVPNILSAVDGAIDYHL